MTKSTYKQSYGVALCRKRPGQPVEFLMIQRRYTYAFGDIIHGKYVGGIQSKNGNKNRLYKLANQLTVEEKLEIMYGDYDKLWYKVWRYNKTPMFDTYKTVFEKNKKHIIDILKESRYNAASPPWEMPKGYPAKGESPLEAAVRELKEETNIQPGHPSQVGWSIYPDKRFNTSTIDISDSDGDSTEVVYRTCYYLAIADHTRVIEPTVDVNSNFHATEILNIAWINMNLVRAISNYSTKTTCPIEIRCMDILGKISKAVNNIVKA